MKRKRYITVTKHGLHIADYSKGQKGAIDNRFMIVSIAVVIIYCLAFWCYVHINPFV